MTNFGILEPSISRQWLKLETSNWACRLNTRGTNVKNVKLGQKGSLRGHVTFSEFLDRICITEWLKLETLNLACRWTPRGTNDKNENLGHYEWWGGHVTYFFCNLGAPSISQERLKLETSNLACRLTTTASNEKNAKLGQRGHKRVTWPTYRLLGLPPYLRNGWSYKLEMRFVMYCFITVCSVACHQCRLFTHHVNQQNFQK